MRIATSMPRMHADARALKHAELTGKLMGIFFKIGQFCADILVDRNVIVELKTGREIDLAWEKQLLNYLRATRIEVGLLCNFGPNAQFRRYGFENTRKTPRDPRVSVEKKLPGSLP